MHDLFHRQRHLDAAIHRSDAWDLAIIGGGASGVGAALDAAARGLSVLLLERSDFGQGTSSRSTKLIHGGVRYLERGNVSLVRESLRERARLLRNAPHIVHPLEFILPCRTLMQVGYYGLGMVAYDWLASSPEFHRSQRLTQRQVLSKLSALSHDQIAGGISYFDGQFDDSRLLINLVHTAAERGAFLVNYATVVELTKEANGQVHGLVFRDEESGKTHRVHSRCVLNATGPFCDSIRKLDQEDSVPLIAASQGIHLVMPKRFFPGTTAMIVPKTKDGRVMFIIPWHDHVLLGTTDTPIPVANDEPIALNEEIDFLLETTADYLQNAPARTDCLSVFVGIRPLVRAKPGRSTASLSRDHFIEISPTGLMTITGGKWTTYRQMAEDCIDQVMKFLNVPQRPSVTQELRLHGAPKETACQQSIYGTDFELIEQLVQRQPELGARVHPAFSIRMAEVIWAVRYEWARTVEDVLARRTRALFLNAQAAISMAPCVAKILADELNRDEKWQTSQVEMFCRVARRYILS